MYIRLVRTRVTVLATVAGCVLAAGGAELASQAAGFVPSQTTWKVQKASGKIVWALDSYPSGANGFKSASGHITEHWDYVGHKAEVTFPFTALRPLGPPGSPAYSSFISPIAGTMSGHATGTLNDGESASCSGKLSKLPNDPGRNATLWMASLGKGHLALYTTAEDPNDFLTTDPCASQFGNIGTQPTAYPDQKRKPTVTPTKTSELRIDPTTHKGKEVQLDLRAEFNLIVTTADGVRHVAGTETTTATLELKLKG